MAWRRPGDKPLSEPMIVCLMTDIYRPMRHSASMIKHSPHKGPVTSVRKKLPWRHQMESFSALVGLTGLKLENYYFFTFTFSRPEVRKLLLFYVFTFSRPEVRKLFRIYVFTFSRPEVRKLFRIYFFTFSRPEARKLFRIYVFTFSRPEVGKLFHISKA